jgi:AcrR family transcriptional regulator
MDTLPPELAEADPADPTDPADEALPTRRRERLRQATLAEIKLLAWQQIAESGAAALSLRAVAREMGMTSSALYRYCPSREALLTALVRDGFSSLADALEAAEAELAVRELGERFIRIARAYRAWSLAHPSEYALIFGTPVPGFEVHEPDVKDELMRGVNVLFRCMIGGIQRGVIHPPPLQGPGAAKLRAKLRAWGAHEAGGLPPAALAGCLFAWTQLHGAISLELFGHMPPEVLPADELFEQQMRTVLHMLRGDQTS